MMTPQQAFKLFMYADWAMMLVGVAALIAAIAWGLWAILLPRYKGRRKHQLLGALTCFLVFVMAWVTQMSVMIPFVNEKWTPLLIVLFASPAVLMLIGLIAFIGRGIRAILQRMREQRGKTVLKSLLGAVVLGVCVAPHTTAMLIPIWSAEDHSNRPGTLTHVGDRAPDFTLTTIEGTPFHTADLRGRVIVLTFFATWCGPCNMEMPHLEAVWNEFRDNDDFRMLVVGREETDASVKAFQEKHGFTFPTASDPKGAVFHKFASQSIPRTYLISRQGTIVYQWTGFYEAEIAKLKKLLSKELAKRE